MAVALGQIVYIREYLESETNTRHLELFLSSMSYSGELTLRNIQGRGPDEHIIKDVHWVYRNKLRDLVVYPEMLCDEFWRDLANDFPQTRYLGASGG